jgi:hypothetical protein
VSLYNPILMSRNFGGDLFPAGDQLSFLLAIVGQAIGFANFFLVSIGQRSRSLTQPLLNLAFDMLLFNIRLPNEPPAVITMISLLGQYPPVRHTLGCVELLQFLPASRQFLLGLLMVVCRLPQRFDCGRVLRSKFLNRS